MLIHLKLNCNCTLILPLLVDAGLDIINPVQTSAYGMSPEWLKKQFGDKITFWGGGIDTQRTIPFGTPEEVSKQVRERIKIFALGGIPWWTTDIGGFFGGDPQDPAFKELIVRWFQFGVFCPIFRLHGFRLPCPDNPGRCSADELTGGPNEIWSFGKEAYEIIKDLLLLRERIKPYIMEQMKKAHDEGIPVMRPLFFDFPDDDITYSIDDEYMFGPDILVAPVLYKGTRSRKVYLPKDAKWTNANTKKFTRVVSGSNVKLIEGAMLRISPSTLALLPLK